MDDHQALQIAKALADGKRFEILQKIGKCKDPDNAPTCTCVKDWTGLAPATVSHHLKELENAGLIHMERAGKFMHLTMRRDVWRAYLEHLGQV